MSKSESDSQMGTEPASSRDREHEKRNQAQSELIKKAIRRRLTHTAHVEEIARRVRREESAAAESGERRKSTQPASAEKLRNNRRSK